MSTKTYMKSSSMRINKITKYKVQPRMPGGSGSARGVTKPIQSTKYELEARSRRMKEYLGNHAAAVAAANTLDVAASLLGTACVTALRGHERLWAFLLVGHPSGALSCLWDGSCYALFVPGFFPAPSHSFRSLLSPFSFVLRTQATHYSQNISFLPCIFSTQDTKWTRSAPLLSQPVSLPNKSKS
jgi:hypothetical protein